MIMLNEDQAQAAVADARITLRRGLGLPDDAQPGTGTSAFLLKLLDRHTSAEARRCPHLAARPLQPWFLALPFLDWRCKACAGELAQRMARRPRPWRGRMEEHVCDACRRYLPSQCLTPAVLRQDLWTITCSLCPRCTEESGAKLVPMSA